MGLESTLTEGLAKARIEDVVPPQGLDPRDSSFVLDPQYRPKIKHNEYFESPNDQIPVIDLGPLSSGDEEQIGKVILEVGKAAEEWGFFQVLNHGVPLGLIDEIKKQAISFFTLPIEEKDKVVRKFDLPLGYYSAELTKNHRDWKEVFDFVVRDSAKLPDETGTTLKNLTNQWPQNPSGLRYACERYAKATEVLAFKMLRLLTQSLGLPGEHLFKYFEKHTSTIRVNYYPACPIADRALGVSRHKDPSAFTILVQDDVGGLQVRRSDGEWIGVKPRPDAFVINIGAMFQVWSNDKFQSIEHQVVVNENRARLSFPMFFNPGPETDVAPVPELLGESNPARYTPINYGYFKRKRNDGNFKQYGEDIQIEHYAIKSNSVVVTSP